MSESVKTIPVFIPEAVNRAMELLPARMNSPEALVLIYAIGLQESLFKFSRQMGNGPARGFWQFEAGGGVAGVLRHRASSALALELCELREVAPITRKVWAALEHDDVLAACFTRLLLFTDPRALPPVTDVAASWEYYINNWRPGKPKPKSWASCHKAGYDLVMEKVNAI